MMKCLDSFPRAALTSLLAFALTSACGGGRDTDGDPDAAAEVVDETMEQEPAGEPASPAPAAATTSAATAPLTTDDIGRWEKGMAGELEAVRAGAERMKAARTGEDTLSAMMAVQENATREAGAKAAGVDLERYKFIRSNLSAAASYLTPQLGGIDTTMLSAEQRAEMRRMNEAQLARLEQDVPGEVIEALRPRAAELRKQDLELVGARVQAVGR